jgi:NADH-quinone oxidoreductase subunit L
VWPLSGFYSKDSILAQALAQHDFEGYLLFAVGVFIAGLTTFYIFRLFFVVFFSKAKSDHVAHAHEPSVVMTGPLVILAVFSLVGGLIGIQELFQGFFGGEAGEAAGFGQRLIEPFSHSPIAASLGLLAFAIGIFGAYVLYANADKDPLPEKLGGLATAMKNKFYFDEIYEITFVRFHDTLAAISGFIDEWIVEGLCIGLIRGGTDLTGRSLRRFQTGNLQTYAFLFVLGVAVALYFVLK